ncbi:adenylate kinase family enzyme [Runella defluvii]|uniref:Adenylate kinase family enzyme n=1 Tax=Runella defluvii TaxID=370973 RepID=A0A7W5ZU88_9BACT|nr:hypothetical protein [Runella defluvii]MBB3842186.1 adenylate kinase family enzyme [Runella defluvii]
MKRYIINIMGPQAVGKSTVIEELKDYLPTYSSLSIDWFRHMYSDGTPNGEMKAWYELYVAASCEEYIILESSGTSNNLKILIESLECEVVHVLLDAGMLTVQLRYDEREKMGYKAPPMYFRRNILFDWPLVFPNSIIINTEKPPYQAAAEIVESLPSEFI